MRAVITGESKISAVTGRSGFTQFSKVSSITYFEDTAASPPSYTVLVALESFWSAKNFRVRMRFNGVQSLALRDFARWPAQLTGFDVCDVSDRQLEGIKFEVRDYENGVIHFFCETAEVESVEAI